MRAIIYKQSYDDAICEMLVDASLEYIVMTCRECDRRGIFYITRDDYQPCNQCKTSGKEYVNLI